MKYFVLLSMICLLGGCQRAVPNDVLLGPSGPETQLNSMQTASTNTSTNINADTRTAEVAAISSSGISEEQDFEVVANSKASLPI